MFHTKSPTAHAACAIVLFAAAATGLRAEAPTIVSAAPAAAAPGREVDVVLQGAGLAGATQVVSTFGPAAKFDLRPGAAGLTLRVALPADAQVGIGAIRVVTPGGVSNLFPFMADDLPSVAGATATNPAAPQRLEPPVAVDGACGEGAADTYQVRARAGQRLSIEVVAARLGSQLDPVLRLLDSAGRELAYCDDAAGAAPDSRLAHTFAADGDYRIEIRDANYDGGPAHRYRLRVGDFPLATVPFPLAAKRGTAAMFSFIGPDCAGAAPLALSLPADRARACLGVRYAGPRGEQGGSGFVAAAAGELDETIEAEPNDSPASATPLSVPSAVSGTFEAAGDRDFYQLTGKKGDRLVLRGRTRSLGSPCDLLLRLHRPDGSRLAESKVEGAGEGDLDVTLPADGVYRLGVEDLNRTGGPGLGYRVEVAPYRPGFSLGVEADKADAKPGGAFDLKVTCARRDYAGPVALSVEGLPAGVTLEGATIAAGKNDTTLKVKLPADAAPGLVLFRVTGAARVGESDFTTRAGTATAMRKVFPRLLYPPDELDGWLALGVQGEGKRQNSE